MGFRIGIVGVSGYGGGEVLRLCANHPEFEVVYVAGESSAGTKLVDRFPGIGKPGDLTIQKWESAKLPALDVLFASLPTGESREPLARVSKSIRIVDIGGDHRFVDGWTYGLADVWADEIRSATHVANPGCYPSAALLAIAPLLHAGLVHPHPPIIIDAKSGVSGAGRGGASSAFGFAEVNEDLAAYGLLKHPHVPEIANTIRRMQPESELRIAFTPHLVPMTRGLLATCYLAPSSDETTTPQCLEAARTFYRDSPFVRVTDRPPHTKWATGTNLCFISYAAASRGPIIAMGAIDNLGKGAAGQAVQNANLMLGIPAISGLQGAPLWP
jgi:N-acetyl-gamma-glutamyl-phosphate reductase